MPKYSFDPQGRAGDKNCSSFGNFLFVLVFAGCVFCPATTSHTVFGLGRTSNFMEKLIFG